MEYELPDTCLVPSRVMYDTDGSSSTRKYIQLNYKTMAELDRDYSGWDNNTSSSTPHSYYYRANYVGIYPAPDFKHSDIYGDIRLNYVLRPSTFTSDTDVPFNDYRHLYRYHHSIIWYVCALCSKDEGDSTMMTFYWQKYISDIALMIERLNNIPGKDGGISR